MRGEGAKRGIKATPWAAPVLGGSKDSRSHGRNCETITVSLRQLRERRGLLRLRSRRPAMRLERMCSGNGGKRGWSLTTALIGCPSAREFGLSVAGGELGRVHPPRSLTYTVLLPRVGNASCTGTMFSVSLRFRTFVVRRRASFVFRLPVAIAVS